MAVISECNHKKPVETPKFVAGDKCRRKVVPDWLKKKQYCSVLLPTFAKIFYQIKSFAEKKYFWQSVANCSNFLFNPDKRTSLTHHHHHRRHRHHHHVLRHQVRDFTDASQN